MTTLYYLSTIIIIFIELRWVLDPLGKLQESKGFSEQAKLNKGKKWDDYSPEFKSTIKSKLWLIVIPIWLFVGLFTFQWVGYLAILVFNFCIVGPIARLFKFSFMYAIIHWINSVIGLAFAFFVIINHYHLKIDLTKLIFTYF